MDKSKPFGLIISKRAKPSRPTASAVFGSDSDDEPSAKKKKMPSIPQAKPKKSLLPEMSEDPSIYEYDSIYDDMKAQEVAKVAPKDSSKPSRYIGSLLKAADKRKKDQERRVEKKVQHERELEGDQFADKEAFVTSAYKKKMQEMEEEEERERRENMLNEMMDVTKQKDLSGFYRHFLKQSVGEEKVPVFGERHAKRELEEVAVKQERLSDEERKSTGNVDIGSVICKEEDLDVDRDTDSGSSSDEDRGVAKGSKEAVVGKLSRKKDGGSVYRSRDVDSAVPEMDKNITSLDSDVDRDTDIGSSGDEDGSGGKFVGWSKDDAVGKLSKKGVLTEKGKSSPDDNIDRDTDIESSSDEKARDGKVIQQSKNTAMGKSSKRNVRTKKGKSSLLEDNIDKNSDIPSKKNEVTSWKRKRSENSGKLSRNIRKRTEDVDSSVDSDDSASTSDDETAEEPLANDGCKEDLSISESVEQVEVQPPKPKVDIYAKRTVGDVFADAQVRYFQRMAARSA